MRAAANAEWINDDVICCAVSLSLNKLILHMICVRHDMRTHVDDIMSSIFEMAVPLPIGSSIGSIDRTVQ